MPASPRQFHVTIGSRFENIELVHAVVREALTDVSLDEETRHWVDLAIREAVANAIQHGNRRDPEKRVEVDLEVDPEGLVVRVQDEGQGFDPTKLRDPLAPENLLRPDGRGLLYINRTMDEVEYTDRPGGGTILTMRKRLPSRVTLEKRGES